MDKQAFFQMARDARAEWDQVLGQVGEARMTVPGVAGDWSAKDMVAHLTAWEQRPVAWLTAIRRGMIPEPAPWPPNLSEEKTNAWIYEANRGRSLDDVLDESRRVHAQLLMELEAISEEDLNDARRFAWLNGNSLADSIPGDSYEHYQDHTRMVREWLALEKTQ